MIFSAAQGISALTRVMEKEDRYGDTIVANACLAMGNLAFGNVSLKNRLFTEGCVNGIMLVLRQSMNRWFQKADELGNAKVIEGKENDKDSGKEKEHSTVSMAVCKLIATISHSQDSRRILMDAGVVEPLINIAEKTINTETASAVAMALCGMSRSEEPGGACEQIDAYLGLDCLHRCETIMKMNASPAKADNFSTPLWLRGGIMRLLPPNKVNIAEKEEVEMKLRRTGEMYRKTSTTLEYNTIPMKGDPDSNTLLLE